MADSKPVLTHGTKVDPRLYKGQLYTIGQRVRFFSEEGEAGLDHTGALLEGRIVSVLGMRGDRSYGCVVTGEVFTGRLFVRTPEEIYSSDPAPPAPKGLLYCCYMPSENDPHCGRIATWATQHMDDMYDRSHACDEHVDKMALPDVETKERLPWPGHDWDQ